MTDLAEGPSQALVPKLTKDQYDLLLYCEQYYWAHGTIPTYEIMTHEGIKYDETDYREAFANLRFLDGLRGRGIPEHVLGDSKGSLKGRLLSERQLTVANSLLDILDKRSRLKKLTELGVSTAEYNTWLRDPIYRDYCLARAEDILVANQSVAHLSLVERVAQGDLGAIKYFNQMTGRYRERSEAGVQVNVQNNYGDDKLIAVVEIIQRHVKDPEILSAIGADILALRGTPVVRNANDVIRAEIGA